VVLTSDLLDWNLLVTRTLVFEFEFRAVESTRFSFSHIFQNFHRILASVAFHFLSESLLVDVKVFGSLCGLWGSMVEALVVIFPVFEAGSIG
jgi:hypothetical protein